MDAIRSIPIGGPGKKDTRYWRWEKKGKYTASSGYKRAVIAAAPQPNQEGPSNTDEQKKRWRTIWELNAPPKVRIFIWKIAWGIVQTETNLARRGIPINPNCFLCGYPQADEAHALVFCQAVRNIWKQNGMWKLMKTRSVPTLGELIWGLSEILNTQEFTLLCMRLWATWKDRCTVKHDPKHQHAKTASLPENTTKWVESFLLDYQKAKAALNTHQQAAKPDIHIEKFKDFNGNKLIVDACFDDEKKNYSIGYEILDAANTCLAAGYQKIQPPGSVLGAETRAVLEGARKLRNLNIGATRIFTDSMDTISANQHQIKRFFGPEEDAIKELREITHRDGIQGIHYLPRSKTKIAYKLAKMATTSPTPQAWIGAEIPRWVRELARELL